MANDGSAYGQWNTTLKLFVIKLIFIYNQGGLSYEPRIAIQPCIRSVLYLYHQCCDQYLRYNDQFFIDGLRFIVLYNSKLAYTFPAYCLNTWPYHSYSHYPLGYTISPYAWIDWTNLRWTWLLPICVQLLWSFTTSVRNCQMNDFFSVWVWNKRVSISTWVRDLLIEFYIAQQSFERQYRCNCTSLYKFQSTSRIFVWNPWFVLDAGLHLYPKV